MSDVLRSGRERLLEKGLQRARPLAERIARLPRNLRQHSLAAVGLAAAAGTAGSVYCGVEAIRYHRLAEAEHAAARSAEIANAELQQSIAHLRDQLGGATQALSAAQRQLGELNDEARDKIAASQQAASSNADRISQLTRALAQAQKELRLAEVQRTTLMARLSKSEIEAAQEHSRRQEEMQAGQEEIEKRLRQLAAEREKIAVERDKAANERDRLRARVGELEQKLALAQLRQQPRPVASAPPAAAAPAVVAVARPPRVEPAPPPRAASVSPAPVALPAPQPEPNRTVAAAAPPPPPQVAPAPVAVAAAAAPPAAAPLAYAPQPPRAAAPAAVPAVAHTGLAQFERVLARAGVDVKHLFSQFDVSRGEGGPYIPARRGSQPAPLTADKLVALTRLVKALPVSAPLESYEISSRFGVRGDPVNAHASLHTGTDLRAPYMSPVYATAEGVVTFSGYRDDYGKIVEIDHGNGLATRYGHLSRATVSVGQHVAAHTQVGFLGSTGRATGPHVHYEVLVNGEPQDPETFMSLGRMVPALAQR
jgi:murein DD-endopeptidase MepM/ murein hydrolase activator NlpD